jgi:hypothetical protein
MNLATVWCILGFSLKMFWCDSDEIPSMSVVSWIVILIFFNISWEFIIFTKGHTAFELGKLLRYLCLFHFLFSKTCLQHFKCLCSICSKICCRHTYLSRLLCLGIQKSQMEQDTFVLRTLHVSWTCCNLIQTESDSADFTLSTPSSRSSC